GHDVLAIDNFDPFYDPEVKRRNLAGIANNPHFGLVQTDICDPEHLLAGIEGRIDHADVIVHLAAKAGVRPSLEQPVESSRVNISGTVAVLELARAIGCRRFVLGSSSSVYGNNSKVPFVETDPADHPISPYAASKRGAELLCHTYHHLHGFSIVCLRF